MKYTIKIIKEQEPQDPKDYMKGMAFMDHGYDRVLFEAPMDSDNCIEILQHLHELKDRKNETK